ncbi:MAG: radical SAM protein [Candidatus Aenigmatarchaeota archaeon]
MKVCFIDPKGVHYGLNNGLAYIAAYLIKHNPEIETIKVFDFNNNPLNIKERLEEVSKFNIIGFSVKSFFSKDIIAMSKKLKNNDNLLIAGGPHVNVDGKNFLLNSLIDVGVLGEGEITTSELIKNGVEKTKGLFYKKGKKLVFNEPRGRITNLDKLPFPDFTVFDSFKGKIFNYPLLTSRGCPFNCIFCSIRKTMGRIWIGRTPKNVLNEIIWAKDKYKISRFNIQDDNFAMDLKRAKKICQMFIDEKINLNWGCYSGIRADRVDEELVNLMAEAGCDGIAVGIESGDEDVFNKIGKAETLEQIEYAVNLFKKYNIKVEGNFIIGLPNSSVETIKNDIKFAKKLKLDSAIFGLLVPFPGTDVFNWVNENAKWLRSWTEGIPQGIKPKILFETETFSKEEMEKMFYKSNIECNNYFAFVDEHLPLWENAISIVKVIIKYDLFGMHRHLFFALKNFKKVFNRIFYKNR